MCSAFLIDRKEDRATVGTSFFQVVFLLGSEMMLVIALFFF